MTCPRRWTRPGSDPSTRNIPRRASRWRRQFQVVGQLIGFEFSRVNVRMRQSVSGVIGGPVHDRNDVVIHNFEEFLCDVILAEGILERQVEFVVGLQHVVTLRIGAVQDVGGAAEIAESPVDVNVHVLVELLGCVQQWDTIHTLVLF